MNCLGKILSGESLPAWRDGLRRAGKKLVVTNGCFDILHSGHVIYLEEARSHGDSLLVGVNDDSGVRELKGPNRPINNEKDRATVLAALQSVDAVLVFPGRLATDFLSLAQPDIYVKGGDYTLETLNREERKRVEDCGARIVLIPFVAGKSTTNTLNRFVASGRAAGQL